MSSVQPIPAGASLSLSAPRFHGAARAPRGLSQLRPARLSLDQISSILWAAAGFARHGHGRAAVPPGCRREVDVYALLPDGAYRYDAAAHRLLLVTPEDLRAIVDNRVPTPAPLLLVYVAAPEDGRESGWEECGVLPDNDVLHVSQNVAAHCAAAGLVCGLRRHLPAKLGSRLLLAGDHRMLVAQRIGLPPSGAH